MEDHHQTHSTNQKEQSTKSNPQTTQAKGRKKYIVVDFKKANEQSSAPLIYSKSLKEIVRPKNLAQTMISSMVEKKIFVMRFLNNSDHWITKLLERETF